MAEQLTKVSERLNEKKFMNRGKPEETNPNTSAYGVGYVTILHELQKTYNWRKHFPTKQQKKEAIPHGDTRVDSDDDDEVDVMKEKIDRKKELMKEKAPRRESSHTREKRVFKETKTSSKPQSAKDKKKKLIEGL